MDTSTIIAAISAVEAAITANEHQIASLDQAIGDGDHFRNIRHACQVASAMRAELAPLAPAEAFQRIGLRLMSTIEGASGPLIAGFFIFMGKRLSGIAQPNGEQFALAFVDGVDAIARLGRATLGDKTMLDVLIPTASELVSLQAQRVPQATLLATLRATAERSMRASADRVAVRGRASLLGEKARGHIDPGCKTVQVAIWAVCDVLSAGLAGT